MELSALVERKIREAVGAAPQVDVPLGGVIRANKTWRNVGASGNLDVIAAYGTGTTLETFDLEFGVVAADRYCASGGQVTTPVDCQVPYSSPLGPMNALVAVGKPDPVTGAITFDDYEIVENAINVTGEAPPPPPPPGVALNAGWNNVAYMGASQGVVSAVASISSFLVIIWVYRQPVWYFYDPVDPGSDLIYLYSGEAVSVQVTQACFWSW